MNLCKAKLPDGKPCPNQADEGQEYCPFHLASQDAETKKNLLPVAGLLLRAVIVNRNKIAKFFVSKKL